MSKANILIVEDESIVAKDIQQSLTKLGYNVLGTYTKGELAVAAVSELKPDLIFMDIMLKGEISGIQAAEQIKKIHDVPVIFLTAYADEDTLNKAKVTEPHGYLLKPFKEVDLKTTVEMALYKHQKESDRRKERDILYSLVEGKDSGFVFVKSNSKMVKVNTNEIVFVEALKDYVTINTTSTKYTIHSTMKDMEKSLPSNEFVRVHRSFIVRLDKISAVDLPNLYIDNIKNPIPIGGSYKDDLIKRLNYV